MARPKKFAKPQNKVVEMEPDSGGGGPTSESEPETPFDDPPASPQNAEAPGPAAQTPPKKRTFWERVAAIPKADWGSRACIYVYCLEPICDLKRGGETKYLVKLYAPIEDENPLMIDYGSGKYRLTLVNRKPGLNKSDTIDNLDIEIYNPKYPPKIPRDVWMNDQRNNRWLALLPKEVPPQPPTPLGTVTDAFDTFTKIQDSIQSRVGPAAPAVAVPPVDRLAEFKSMLDIAKGAMPAPAPPATDNKVLDTVVTLMMKQLDASQAETKELRQEMRDMMRDRQTQQTPAADTNIEGLLDKFEKIAPRLTSILGLGGDKLTDVVHGRKRTFLEELGLATLPPLVQDLSPIIPMLARRFMMPGTNGGLGAPAANGQQPAALPPGQQQPPAPGSMQEIQQRVGSFLGANITPMRRVFEDFLKQKLRDDDDPAEGKIDGSDFAAWVYEYHGGQVLQDARTLGSGTILQMFKASPLWISLSAYEGKLVEFLDQALRFDPPSEEPPAEPPADNKPVVVEED